MDADHLSDAAGLRQGKLGLQSGDDGRLKQFRDEVVSFENAGHWVHHDRLQAFVDTVGEFIE